MTAAALGVLTWVLVGRTLRPVERIRAEVAEIGGSDLHRRVPVPAADDEVGRLATTMNDMLARVEEGQQRQRRFVADASHELRGPLTRMRTELEVDLEHPATADAEATHRSVLEEVVGLQQLVDDLLMLARSDGGIGDVADAGSGRPRRARPARSSAGPTVAPASSSSWPVSPRRPPSAARASCSGRSATSSTTPSATPLRRFA